MQYPVFIHKESKSDYGVIVPDLPGCFSAGHTLEEAIQSAHEAIECHLEGLLIDGEDIPLQRTIEEHLNNPELKNAIVAVVDINLSKISGKAKRINITLPDRILKQINKYAKSHGINRSAFLADAALRYMAEHRT